MDRALLDLDDEQHVQAGQSDGVDGEEVGGQQPTGLRAQELVPGGSAAPRCRVEPVAAQDPPHRRGRHADPE
jgi:hypothetical protein